MLKKINLSSHSAPTMASSSILSLTSILLLISSFQFIGSQAATFTVLNKCSHAVWPGLLSTSGTDRLPTTGFALQPAESNVIPIPPSWSGRLWGRTFCSQGSASSNFTCLTGDCGSSIECSGNGPATPVTLAEFTLNGTGGLDFFDVTLVNGYNVPILIQPQGGNDRGNCSFTGCDTDLNPACPATLQVTAQVDGSNTIVACKSACSAFSSPETCKPNSYSDVFKKRCPRAYSTFSCGTADYIIVFCSSDSPSGGKPTQTYYDDPYFANLSVRLTSSSGRFIVALIALLQMFF